MITKRPANTRGFLKLPFIESYRTFSNNSYRNSNYINYSDLEVINDDRVSPGHHVPQHLHKNMEILGYVIEGPCKHIDNKGNNFDIPSGYVQFMSAGSGIRHTEGNDSDHWIRYLQLWIKPSFENSPSTWQYREITREQKLNNFCMIGGNKGGFPIKQEVQIYAGIFTEPFNYQLETHRRYYVYVVLGTGTINDDDFIEGDGYAIENEAELSINSSICEIILFNLR